MNFCSGAAKQVAAITALFTLAVLPLGCDEAAGRTNPDDWAFPEWSRKSDEIGSGLTATRDPSILAFDGYNHVADVRVGRNCVLPEPGELKFASFRAGGDLFKTELTYISSREELEQALELDAAASIKLGPIGGGGSLGIARTYKSSERSLAILLRTRQIYSVINQDEHNLTGEALDLLESDTAKFVRECGTGYVAGVAYGAELTLLIQIDASSVDESKSIKSKLEAEGIKAGPASISPSLGGSFSRALAEQNASVSVQLEARGFVPSVDINALAALDEKAFEVAAAAQSEMKASVAHDKCHDQGDAGPGTCDGEAARGYLANGARVAVPMGVLHTPFQRASNFPGDAAIMEGLLMQDRIASGAMATLADYAELYRGMLGIHNDEVGAMLASDTPYDFAIYDTSEAPGPAMSFSELTDHAKQWASAYDPDHGSEVAKLAEAIADCWSRAQFGDFTECQVRPDETKLGAEVVFTMVEYAKKRVRPVYYTFSPMTTPHHVAETACTGGFRMPGAAEASRLWFALERNPAIPAATDIDGFLQSDIGAWYDDRGVECRESETGWIEKLGDGTFRTGCHENGFFTDDPELVALCVPTSGVYGSAVPDLPFD